VNLSLSLSSNGSLLSASPFLAGFIFLIGFPCVRVSVQFFFFCISVSFMWTACFCWILRCWCTDLLWAGWYSLSFFRGLSLIWFGVLSLWTDPVFSGVCRWASGFPVSYLPICDFYYLLKGMMKIICFYWQWVLSIPNSTSLPRPCFMICSPWLSFLSFSRQWFS
jgi:hypothetical protein